MSLEESNIKPRVPIIHCLIPARSGSKGIKDKNIMLLNGKPMMAYTIELVKQLSGLVSKVVVSTDSLEYAEIAKKYGAETPYLRPADISGDRATDLDVADHYLKWIQKNRLTLDWPTPDVILHLRVTFPKRRLEDLKEFIEKFLDRWDEYDSARSIIPSPETPYKMYLLKDHPQMLMPLYSEVDGIQEPYNQARQILPQVYLHNGCYDIVKTEVIQGGSMTGKRIMPYLMESKDNGDIDNPEDLEKIGFQKLD